MKHTRGPWYVRQSIKGPYIAAGEGALAETAIAKVLKARRNLGVGLDVALEQEANARLLAAAPDLWFALTQMCMALTLGELREDHPVAVNARALLAKINSVEIENGA